MEKAIDSHTKASSHDNVAEDNLSDEIRELLSTLSREKNLDGTYPYQYDSVWYYSDIILITCPKSDTTWLKYSSLTDSRVNSNCGIVYMCRNPLDQFITYWHFLFRTAHEDMKIEPFSLEEAFEMACHGIQEFGPVWEHVLGYWKANLDDSDQKKVLFLKYEDVKEDSAFYVKKLADFLGCPFSNVEENQGVIEEIVKLCSFENMKDLEVNKNGGFLGTMFKNSMYFGEGKVGDWTNYFTLSMSKCLKNITEEKLSM
ncbi:hypothetical protein ACOSQ3_013023 [Xanthoceras sorbifolium]